MRTLLDLKRITRKLRSAKIKPLRLWRKDGSIYLRCACSKCNHLWGAYWGNLQQGHGCPRCSGSLQLTTREVKARLRKINSDLRILGEYKNSKSQLRVHCLSCGCMWSTRWNDLSNGHGCPQCRDLNRGATQRLSLEKVKRRLKKLHPQVEVLEKRYVNALTPMRCRCKGCGKVWRNTWGNFQQGCGCACGAWKSENEVREIIERLTGTKWPPAPPSEVPWLHGLHLDGYDKKNKRAFEFDGDQHDRVVPYFHGKGSNAFTAFKEAEKRDWRKNKQCWRHGIKLVRIPYKVKDKKDYIRAKLKRLGWI